MHKELPLSDKLKQWRAERPDEWKMDEFIRDATLLEGLVTGYLTELCDLYDRVDNLEWVNDWLVGKCVSLRGVNKSLIETLSSKNLD